MIKPVTFEGNEGEFYEVYSPVKGMVKVLIDEIESITIPLADVPHLIAALRRVAEQQQPNQGATP